MLVKVAGQASALVLSSFRRRAPLALRGARRRTGLPMPPEAR